MLELAELATTGATAVVAAMATTAWDSTRESVVRLFRRGDTAEEETVQVQLASHDDLVRRTEDTERARRALLPLWELQLEAFLIRYPEAADDLRALITRSQDALRQAQRPSVVQNITASAPGATAAGVTHGNAYLTTTTHYGGPPEATAPGPATGGSAEGAPEGAA
ncbi:hypothetical protein ACTVZO_36485 [Streptomyces sp. IBSNAI002]|uniref:hypothetical protein n=1 Tax=Streptomyces sp. IBSNAI002 TaxID=3457500 RepID=UPI003FCFDBC5